VWRKSGFGTSGRRSALLRGSGEKLAKIEGRVWNVALSALCYGMMHMKMLVEDSGGRGIQLTGYSPP
jgi:hypothetical protein